MQILNADYDRDSFVTKAQGQYIWLNGKKCIDFAMGGGVHLFGHSPRFVRKAVEQAMKNGTHYAHPNFAAQKFGYLFSALTGHERMVFCNTGTEANMRAMRIARAVTGRHKIAILKGSWHGSSDLTLWLDYPKGVVNTEVVIYEPWMNLSDVAMVFCELHQGSCPSIDYYQYSDIRKHTEDYGTLLGFDEVITGIRLGHRFCMVKPDISTYGKLCGGGFPIGIVAGRAGVMDIVKDGVFMGGTFSGNPISVTAGYEVLKRVTRNTLTELDHKANTFRNLVNSKSNRIKLIGVGSFLKVILEGLNLQKEELVIKKRQLVLALRKHGVHIGMNFLVFLSTKHTSKDLVKASRAFYDAESILER